MRPSTRYVGAAVAALGLASGLSGCVAMVPMLSGALSAGMPVGTTGLLVQRDPASAVRTMAGTFSLAQNESLKEAIVGLKAALDALSVSFTGLTPTFRVAEAGALPPVFRLAGVHAMGGAEFDYDDATRELTAIRGNGAEATFRFVNNGATRSLAIALTQAPDGTTGTADIEVTAPVWRTYPSSTVPFLFMNNELPIDHSRASYRLAVVPKGDRRLAVDLTMTEDEPVALARGMGTIRSHWVATARLPGVSLDWEHRLKFPADKARFDGTGTATVDTTAGRETFRVLVAIDEAARTGDFHLTHVGARVRLEVKLRDGGSSQPAWSSELVGVDTGARLGTVALDASRPRYAIVTLNDGTRLDWELYPAGVFTGTPFQAFPMLSGS